MISINMSNGTFSRNVTFLNNAIIIILSGLFSMNSIAYSEYYAAHQSVEITLVAVTDEGLGVIKKRNAVQSC